MLLAEWILKKTVGTRHKVAKFLAPKLFMVNNAFYDVLASVPRPMTLFLKEYFGDAKLEGAEIGVAHGINAVSILQNLCVKKLWLVDFYGLYYENGARLDFSGFFEEAKRNLSAYPNAEFIVKSSCDASLNFEKESLDFVYIDGNHDYDSVKLDLEKYYPLVKISGVIGGHDYTPLNKENVVRAVDEFVKRMGLRQCFFAVFPDWWVIKK